MPTKRKKRPPMCVIFARPQQFEGAANLFIASDGTTTESRKRAAKFFNYGAAKDFAKERNIELDGSMTYIGLMDFTEAEIRSG